MLQKLWNGMHATMLSDIASSRIRPYQAHASKTTICTMQGLRNGPAYNVLVDLHAASLRQQDESMNLRFCSQHNLDERECCKRSPVLGQSCQPSITQSLANMRSSCVSQQSDTAFELYLSALSYVCLEHASRLPMFASPLLSRQLCNKSILCMLPCYYRHQGWQALRLRRACSKTSSCTELQVSSPLPCADLISCHEGAPHLSARRSR